MLGSWKIRGLAQLAAAALALSWTTAGALAGSSNGNFQVKVGVTGVLTDDDTNSLKAGAVDLLALGAHASTDDIVIPSLTLTYYLNTNLAVELFCCFGKTSLKGEGLIGPLGEIGETWMFPPILTLQYHFDGMGPIRPYVGAGVEWIHYFSEDLGHNGLGAKSIDLNDSFGFAIQAGADLDLGGGWSLGADVKKVWEDTEVTWRTPTGSIKADHDIDPLILTANLGYRFNLSDIFGK